MVHARLFLIKTSLLLLVISIYAEEPLQSQQQHDRQQRSRQSSDAYVNKVENSRKWKFGDKKPKTPNSNANATRQSTGNAENLNKSNRLLQQQFTEYELPIIEKQKQKPIIVNDDDDDASSYNKGQQQQLKIPFNNSSRHHQNYVARSRQKSMQHERRLVATTNTTTRNLSRQQKNITNNSKVIERKQQQPQQQRSSSLLNVRPNFKKSAIITTTTTTTTTKKPTTTTTTTQRPNFLSNNPFNIFSPFFWSFSNPQTTPRPTQRKPPKKYTPTTPPTTSRPAQQNERKIEKAKLLSKPKTTPAPSTTTTISTAITTSPNKRDSSADAPFRIALPTFNFFNAETPNKQSDPQKEKEKRAIVASLRERYICPRESEVRFQLFPKICKIDEDCSVWNREELCCEIFGAKSCVSGVAKPLEESSHSPILGIIPRKCPSRPLAELWWEVKECNSDMDCWPRVCCPDGRRRYCRTSQPELETAPVPVRRSFDYLTEYLECTPPPPPIFDLHPKACTSTFDCFPNVCCQEAGLRHCRPPKKSVLTLMANFLNNGVVKRFAQNIVIK